MKKLFLIILCCTAGLFEAKAQIGAQIQCGIYFDYDAAGNRIKRYYDCKDARTEPDYPPAAQGLTTDPSNNQPSNRGTQNTPATDHVDGDSKVTLYPNPTQDQFYIKLPEVGTHTHFHLYDAKGAIISSGYIDGELYEGHIGNLPAGEYTVIVYYQERNVAFKVTKI